MIENHRTHDVFTVSDSIAGHRFFVATGA